MLRILSPTSPPWDICTSDQASPSYNPPNDDEIIYISSEDDDDDEEEEVEVPLVSAQFLILLFQF